MSVAQKICILGAISLNKIFIKICSHPKISCVTPPISHEKILWSPQLFHAPPYSEENDSPPYSVLEQKGRSVIVSYF